MIDDIGEWELYKLYKDGAGGALHLDEQEVCIHRQKFCTLQELDRINVKIALQAERDKNTNVHSTSSNKGFSTEKVEPVTKPATQAAVSQQKETRKGTKPPKGRETDPPVPTTATTTTTTTTTAATRANKKTSKKAKSSKQQDTADIERSEDQKSNAVKSS